MNNSEKTQLKTTWILVRDEDGVFVRVNHLGPGQTPVDLNTQTEDEKRAMEVDLAHQREREQQQQYRRTEQNVDGVPPSPPHPDDLPHMR